MATSVHTYTGMDPRLQRIVARGRRGITTPVTASSEPGMAVVIAKVTDLKKWEQLSEVRVGATLGREKPKGPWLVTGRIPTNRTEYVRQQPFVKSLKGAQLLQPTLDATTRETQGRPDVLPTGNQTAGGSGTVVGIIDYGMDFVYRNFRKPGGSTRLRSIWRQGAPATPDSPFGYGREYTQDQINRALEEPDPYRALGYWPATDRLGRPEAMHGTHVTDIAAGNGRASQMPGLAPRADIVFVDVAPTDIPGFGPEVVGSSFGDSVRLVEAVQYIFDNAGERPCVINISLGTNGGPHDGSTLVEEAIDLMVRDVPNRAVVISAGNSYADGIHAAGTVTKNGSIDLSWEVSPGDYTHNELELWYSGRDRFAVEVLAPGGESLLTVKPDSNESWPSENPELIFVSNRLDDPNNHDNVIGIFLERRIPGVWNPGGQWIVRLHGLVVQDGAFHAWIERDDHFPSRFALPHNNAHTIGSLSCGHDTIVVGSYNAHKGKSPLSHFSSAGPTRDSREKPEISAPGHDVLAAHSGTLAGVVRKSGTSMAAPVVTGIVALIMAQAQAQGISLSVQQIRRILADTARRNPPRGKKWHDRFGNGRVSGSRAVAAVMALSKAGPSRTTRKRN